MTGAAAAAAVDAATAATAAAAQGAPHDAAAAAAAAAALPPPKQPRHWLSLSRRYAAAHPTELVALICDAVTAVLVVAVQDIAFKESMTACAALQVVSFLCNWHAAAALRQRRVFPKAIEVMVPLLCLALAPAAWLAEAATHRAVYVAICSTAALTMLATTVLRPRGRSFAAEYMVDWYPPSFWRSPFFYKLERDLAWTWILTQALMAAAAAVVMVAGDANAALYVACNYVLQLLPLALSVAATALYPAWLKRRFGFDADDALTGWPPSERAALAAAGGPPPVVEAEALPGGLWCGWGGGGGGGGGGSRSGGSSGGRSLAGAAGSRRALLAGDEESAAAVAPARLKGGGNGSSGRAGGGEVAAMSGDAPTVVIATAAASAALTPSRRPRRSSAAAPPALPTDA